ncbi:hypothetical protein BKA69DRAFT_649589 [Paraphysoderma sedebokerense]|nr:hypothetical protein BKA69DRAFT_649589 [Paraphysoderma sedebokerense]
MDNQSDDGQSTLLMMVDQCLTAVREVIRFCDLAVEQFEDKVQRNDMFVSENGGSIADLTADRAKAMLVKLGFDLIYKFLSIEMDGEEKSVIWLVFRNFLQGLESTSVPRTICEEIINDVKSSNIYLFLLSNKSKVLRQTAYSCLLNDIRLRATTSAQGNGLLEREELLNEIITYGLNDTFSEIQAIAKDIIITFITEFTQASILRPYIPLLQIFLSDDAPQFVQILIDKCPDISAFETLTYRIRGLFQKKEIVRKVVSHQLLQTLRLRETSMEICDAPHEAFVFSASFVDSLNVEKDVALMTISGLHVRLNLEIFLQTVINEYIR